jgi:precorrin-6B methylase 2
MNHLLSARFAAVVGRLALLSIGAPPGFTETPATSACAGRYELRSEHSPDGIGVFFLGREIAHVMSHAGADWLERPEREAEERPDLLLRALRLQPGDVVADVGAGTGYHAWRLAEAVASAGRVYAVEVQPEMLDRLRPNMAARGITNVVPVLGTSTDPRLPEGALDCILMVDVYHEFDRPCEMLERLCRALKPSGRLVFVEFRAEDEAVPIKPLHKMSERQIRREAALHPLEWVETITTLPWQHVVTFRKPGPEVGRPPAETPAAAAE